MTRPPTPAADAYAKALADVRKRVLGFATAAWNAATSKSAPGGQFGQPALDSFVTRVVPVVSAGQQRVANLTSAHIAATTGTKPVKVDTQQVTGGRGVPPTRVYARPMIVARSTVKELADPAPAPSGLRFLDDEELGPGGLIVTEDPVAEAIKRGGLRLEQLVSTDLQMATIRQADESLQAAGITRYRRVPRGAHTCALCLIASTQTYKVGTLLPIHPGCDCGVEQIPEGLDLDDLVDTTKLLNATHAKVKDFTGVEDRGGRAVDYRKLLVTHEHGEIGEILAWNGQKFTSAADIPHLTGPVKDLDKPVVAGDKPIAGDPSLQERSPAARKGVTTSTAAPAPETSSGTRGPGGPGGPGGPNGPRDGGSGNPNPWRPLDPKWFRASREYVNSLTGRYRQSVIAYTGSGHQQINGWLRRRQTPADTQIQARVRDIDAVLAKRPLELHTILTRTTDLSSFGLTSGDGLKGLHGLPRRELGYMSTTRLADGGRTATYKNPVRLTVLAPPGTHAAAIEDISKVPGQGEILLGRNLMYVIVDSRYDGDIGMWRATVRIVKEVTP